MNTFKQEEYKIHQDHKNKNFYIQINEDLFGDFHWTVWRRENIKTWTLLLRPASSNHVSLHSLSPWILWTVDQEQRGRMTSQTNSEGLHSDGFCLSLRVKGTKQKPPSCQILRDDFSPIIETEGVRGRLTEARRTEKRHRCEDVFTKSTEIPSFYPEGLWRRGTDGKRANVALKSESECLWRPIY